MDSDASTSARLTMLRRLVGDYLPPRAVCPMVAKWSAYPDYDAATFCAHCPDADKIPADCDLSCGWPTHIAASRGRECPHIEECPCARPCSGERAQALCEWQRGHKERAGYVSDLINDRTTGGETLDDEAQVKIGRADVVVKILG